MKIETQYSSTNTTKQTRNLANVGVRKNVLDEWICKEDPNFMIVLNKFEVAINVYENVLARLEAMRFHLIDDVEYEPEDLIHGRRYNDVYTLQHAEVVLCLKHIVAQPNSWLREVTWGTFECATSKSRK